MNFRKLGRGDLSQMRELNEVFAAAFNDPTTHLTKKPTDRYLQDFLAKSHIITLAAFDGEKVVGGLVAYNLEKYEQERSEIYIYDLAVDETYRRQGIARNLILKLKEIGKTMGAWVILVQADKIDDPAVALYRSMGTEEEPLHFDISID